MEIIDEKREHFRVKLSIPIYYRPVGVDEIEGLRELIRSGRWAGRGGPGTSPVWLSSREVDVAVLQMLREINRKLDLIMEHLGLEASGLFKRGKMIDLSGSGVRFSGDRMEKGEVLELSFDLPSTPPRSISALAEVVNVKLSALSPSKAELGCRFTEISEDDREAIIAFCESIKRGRSIPPIGFSGIT
ncbi:hypothetical protein DRP77_06125 [Candidatus Poribacteria bacterium]|nr:MAG: hypothetical protein DRP77_06125 [Candidatus Poribacteria bacterium]